MSDREQIGFTIDPDTKELAKQKLDHGELSKQLRRAVEQIAFGEEVSRRSKMEARLDDLQDREAELVAERDSIESELAEVRDKIDRVEERLDDLESVEDEYNAALEMLEDQLYSGVHVDPEHGQVKKAAHLGECDPLDVINDLQERNPSIPDYAFRQQMHVDETWTGIAESEGKNGDL